MTLWQPGAGRLCLIFSLTAWGCQSGHNGPCDSLGWQGGHYGPCDSLGWQSGDFALSASFWILNEIMRPGPAVAHLTRMLPEPEMATLTPTTRCPSSQAQLPAAQLSSGLCSDILRRLGRLRWQTWLYWFRLQDQDLVNIYPDFSSLHGGRL